MGQLNYSTGEVQKRLEQGYYDDIVKAGYTGTKAELDAILAKVTSAPATQSANGLMSSTDKKRLDGAVVLNDVGAVSLGALPVNKYSLKYTYNSASPIAIAFAGTPEEGREFMLDILNSTAADINQPLPNASPWQSEDATVTLAAGKVTPISIRYVHGKYCVRT